VELYYLASPDATPRRLTSYNDTTAALALGRMEEVTWGNEGWNENGILVYPPDFSAERKYPLVLLIHGGPESASKTSFGSLPQYLASHGWLVFMPNYRGSDNLGNAYQSAITAQWGKGPGRDVMAGIAVLKKRPYVDPGRMAVTGWSYGGYMTVWLAGNYPSAWRAAIAGAPVTSWLMDYNLSDANVRIATGLGGSPWIGNHLTAYAENSPITHAPRIRAPTLIMSKTQDFRVPTGESYLLYHALKDNGVTTQFIAYPGRGHFPGDPVSTMDVYRRWAAWLQKYLGDPQVGSTP
jgi:dipeptidyl aminopeptidase/acylaminoacyl peptidase